MPSGPDLTDRIALERARQGLPPRIEDESVLAKVVSLLAKYATDDPAVNGAAGTSETSVSTAIVGRAPDVE